MTLDVHTTDDFATLLRRHRLAVGLTQEELAEQAHFSARGISDLERGVTTRPRKDTVQLLVEALRLTAEERVALEMAARAVRADPERTNEDREGSGNLRKERSSGKGTDDLSSTLDRSHVSMSPNDAPERRRSGLYRLPSLAGRKYQIRVVAAAVAFLVLIGIIWAGLVGRGPVGSSGGVKASSLSSRGALVPWGLARTSRAHSMVHVDNALRVAVDRQGNLYVTEGSGMYSAVIPRNHADILKLSPTGRILARWGHYGSRRGELKQPAGVAVDGHGNVYVADFGNDRIQKFSPSGRVLDVWGSYGTSPGHFDLPLGIALDSHGDIYVTDYFNNRVQELSPSGRPLAVWGHGCGEQLGQFCGPTDVVVGPTGSVYVVDQGNWRIQTISSTGRLFSSWRSSPNAAMGNTFALAVDKQGKLYLTNHYGTQISTFTASGVPLDSWGVDSDSAIYALCGIAIDPTGYSIAVSQNRLYRSSPDGLSHSPLAIVAEPAPARFDQPSVLAVDRNRAVYVLSGSSDNVLHKLTPSGIETRQWGRTTFAVNGAYDLTGLVVDNGGNIYVSDVLSGHILKVSPAGKLLERWGSEGSAPGHFSSPYGLTVDTHGFIYVADSGNDRIQKLSPSGLPVARWGQSGTRPGQFNVPRAVTVDAQGALYVADTGNHRIQKLSPSGKPLAVWGGRSSGRPRFRELTSVTVDTRGNVYTVDAVGNRVIELSPAGTVVAQWGNTGAGKSRLRGPDSVVIDKHGNLYVTDTENNRVEKLVRVAH